MQIRRVVLRRAPGVSGLELEELSPQLVVLVGPNASGKSTLARTIQSVLWPEQAHSQLDAEIEWTVEGRASPQSAQLVAGHVEWSEAPPRCPPEAGRAWKLSIADLIQPRGTEESRIAAQIYRELAGGYDLTALRDSFKAYRPKRGERKQLDREYTAAFNERRGLLNAHAELARQEDSLARLLRERDEAAQANADAQQASVARDLAQHREELARLQEQLRALPAALRDLPRDTLDRVQAERAEREVVQAELLEAERRLSTLDEPSLPAPVRALPSRDELAAWQTRASDLERAERRLEELRPEHARAQAQRRAAHVQLFSAPAPRTTRDIADHVRALERALEERKAQREHRRAADLKFRALSGAETKPHGEISGTAEDLQVGLRALADWLSAHPPPRDAESPASPGWLPPLLIIAGIALTAFGALTLDDLGRGLAPVGAALFGLGIGLLWSRRSRSNSDTNHESPRTYERQFQRTGLDAPATWAPEPVQARIREIAQAIVEVERRAERDQARSDAHTQLRGAESSLATAEAAVAELLESLEIAPNFADALLSQQARWLEELAREESEHAGVRAKLEEAERAYAEDRGALQAWLTQYWEPSTPDAAAINHAVDALSRALEDEGQRVRGRDECIRNRDRLRASAEASAQKITSLYLRAGVPDGDEWALKAQMQHVEPYQKLEADQARLDTSIATEQAKLKMFPDLLNLTVLAAEERIEGYQALAATLAERSEAIAKVNQDIEAMGVEGKLEKATLAVDRARHERDAYEDRCLTHEVSNAVLDFVEETMSTDNVPRVLERARDWFSRFTHGRYRLQLQGKDGFEALDARDGRARALEALSDGTRVQLLLAVRLAFLEQAEGDGPKLPLFLDEVLSTTDPARFEAIGRCVLELSRDGRQVIYATADDAEAHQWKVLCDDVGDISVSLHRLGEPATPSWPEDLPVAPTAPVPVAVEHLQDPRAYAQATGLQPPRRGDPASAWPLGLVLYDALEAAERCRQASVVGVGQLVQLGATAVEGLSEEIFSVAQVRLSILEDVLGHARVGHGTPIEWSDVQQSKAITEAFEERARALFVRHRDEPRRFVAEIAGLKSFRKDKREQLEAHLREQGHIPEDQPLSRQEILYRSSGVCAEAVAQGAVEGPDARRFVEWVLELLDTPVGLASGHGSSSRGGGDETD